MLTLRMIVPCIGIPSSCVHQYLSVMGMERGQHITAPSVARQGTTRSTLGARRYAAESALVMHNMSLSPSFIGDYAQRLVHIHLHRVIPGNALSNAQQFLSHVTAERTHIGDKFDDVLR